MIANGSLVGFVCTAYKIGSQLGTHQSMLNSSFGGILLSTSGGSIGRGSLQVPALPISQLEKLTELNPPSMYH